MTNGMPSTGTSELSVTRLLGPVVAAGGLFLILLSPLHRLPWDVPKRTLVVVFLVAGAYALTAWGLAFVDWRGRRATLAQAMVFAGAASLPGPLAYGVLQPPVGFGLVLIGLGAVFALTIGTFLLRGSTRWTLAAQGTLAVAAVAAQAAANFSTVPVQNASNVVSEFLDTSLYDLDAVYFRPLPESPWFQGGITRFGDRYLLAYGNGELYVFSRSGREKLDIERLAYETPINIADFEAAAGTKVAVNQFRVADALSQQTSTGLRLFVTHHYWNVRDECWVMRVSALEGSLEDFLSPSAPLQWSTVYETAPCIGLAVTDADPVRFSGIENGGKMAFIDDNRLLVTFGDHEMDGWATTVAAAQDPEWSYGKTILIDLTTRQGEVFTRGHRNPHGLHVSGSGTIWATEHGPQGGDELNRIVQGRNYGWSLATYGVEYGTNVWPLTKRPGAHDGFEPPFFSWIPSIGVSAVLEVASPRFENWRGDLLVSSLVGQTLWRLRVRGERVELAEQIHVGRRIRDIEEGHDGELVMWTDDHAIAFIAPGEGVASGEYLYRVCAGCHVAPAGTTTAVGPLLVDVVGREIASVRGFGYSPALEELGGTWTRERLDAYIRDPRAMVPGTTMYFAGIEDERAREVLLDYLESSSSQLDVAPLAPL